MPDAPRTVKMNFRSRVRPADRRRVRDLVAATGFFSPAEIDIAVELVDERLAKGDASGYYFLFAESGGRLCGYTCYGLIPCTAASYDLYWIVVAPAFQRRRVGRSLMTQTERRISAAGGTRIYADTSGRRQYAGTRAFYGKCGYRKAAALKDFYSPGDDKVVCFKVLG
jgi:ribosomal protein S18 acetylase RimI-like enzyme